MRKLALVFAALALVPNAAVAQQAAAVLSPDVPLDPNDSSGLRKIGAELLFWSQAQRDESGIIWSSSLPRRGMKSAP